MFDLQMFAEMASTGAEEQAGAEQGAEVVYGKAEEPEEVAEPEQTGEPAEDLDAAFDELIKGKFAEQYKARVQRNIQQRFKERQENDAIASENARLREMIAERYDLDGGDFDSLLHALDEDESPAEREAYEEGKSKAEIRAERILRREQKRIDAERRQQEAEQQRRSEIERWAAQAEEAKSVYSNLDLVAELKNEDTGEKFLRLLKADIPVKEAYEAIHHQELVRHAITASAGEAEKRTVDNIRARGMRPAEAGNGNTRAVIRKDNPEEFTASDIANIMARVRRGEKIRF